MAKIKPKPTPPPKTEVRKNETTYERMVRMGDIQPPKGAAQGAYESPEIIHDADGVLAGADALSGITDAIQIQALKNSKEGETDTETDTETSGSPRIVTYLRNIK